MWVWVGGVNLHDRSAVMCEYGDDKKSKNYKMERDCHMTWAK